MTQTKIPYLSAFSDELEIPESELLPHSRPFWLRNEDSKSVSNGGVVICLHGYTATSYESKPIGEAIHKMGVDAAGLVMPGHGLKDPKKAKRIMKQIKTEDWLESVRTEISLARKHYKKIYMYGQSMGGLISIIMAEESLVDGIALTAPALKLHLLDTITAQLLFWTKLSVPKNYKGQEFFNEAYTFQDANSGYQLLRMTRMARKNLHKINCPVLLCHSKQDPTITPKIVEMMKKNITYSETKLKVKWFNESGHTMPLDVQGEEVAVTIAKFFKELEKNGILEIKNN